MCASYCSAFAPVESDCAAFDLLFEASSAGSSNLRPALVKFGGPSAEKPPGVQAHYVDSS
jgi:hypothetical protein